MKRRSPKSPAFRRDAPANVRRYELGGRQALKKRPGSNACETRPIGPDPASPRPEARFGAPAAARASNARDGRPSSIEERE